MTPDPSTAVANSSRSDARALAGCDGAIGHPRWPADGFIVFAATMMILVGIFHVIDGLVVLVDNDFYVVARAYTFQFDVTSWGWIHLVLGVIIAFAGWGLLSGRTWARAVALIIAGLSVIASWERRREAAASPTGALRGLLSQTQALADMLDGRVSVPVRPMLCVHGHWPARASRLFSRVRVAPLRQLADAIRSGSATTPDAVELASARLLAALRPAA